MIGMALAHCILGKFLGVVCHCFPTPCVEEIIRDHQCGFQHNMSTTAHIFCICQIFDKKLEYIDAMHQIFIDFKKAYDSVRREVLYNILIEFRIPMKLVRLIKMCVNENHSRIWVGKRLSDTFCNRSFLPVQRPN